jgi:hypothetical protein
MHTKNSLIKVLLLVQCLSVMSDIRPVVNNTVFNYNGWTPIVRPNHVLVRPKTWNQISNVHSQNHINYLSPKYRVIPQNNVKLQKFNTNPKYAASYIPPIIYYPVDKSKLRVKTNQPQPQVYSILPKTVLRPSTHFKDVPKKYVGSYHQNQLKSYQKPKYNTSIPVLKETQKKFKLGPVQFGNSQQTVQESSSKPQVSVSKDWMKESQNKDNQYSGNTWTKVSDAEVIADNQQDPPVPDNAEIEKEFQQIREGLPDDARYKFPGHWATPNPISGL